MVAAKLELFDTAASASGSELTRVGFLYGYASWCWLQLGVRLLTQVSSTPVQLDYAWIDLSLSSVWFKDKAFYLHFLPMHWQHPRRGYNHCGVTALNSSCPLVPESLDLRCAGVES